MSRKGSDEEAEEEEEEEKVEEAMEEAVEEEEGGEGGGRFLYNRFFPTTLTHSDTRLFHVARCTVTSPAVHTALFRGLRIGAGTIFLLLGDAPLVSPFVFIFLSPSTYVRGRGVYLFCVT